MLKKSTLSFKFRVIVFSLSFLFLGVFDVSAQNGFPYSDSFKTSTLNNTFLGTTTHPVSGNIWKPVLTAGTIDPEGSGYLRLTEATGQTNGFVYNTTSFSSNNGLDITFEYYIYQPGVSGADGLTFFLFDKDVLTRTGTASTSLGYPGDGFFPGGFGGSLGYAQREPAAGIPTPLPGLSKGFVGIAFDEFGNFSTQNQGRQAGNGTTALKSSVTLRGDGDGAGNNHPFGGTNNNYLYLTSVRTSTTPGLNFELAGGVDGRAAVNPSSVPTNSSFRKARILMEPATVLGGPGYKINVYITEGGVALPHHVIVDYMYKPVGPIPTNLSYGFASSTGGAVNFHEIRTLDIVVPSSVPLPPTQYNTVTATTNEDAPHVFTLPEFTTKFLDPNGFETLDHVIFNTLPDPLQGKLTLNNVDITNATQVTAANITGGLLRFVPAANWHGVTTGIKWTGYDGGNLFHATPGDVTVTVNSINDEPAGTDKTIPLAVSTSHTMTAADFGFTDPSDTSPPTGTGTGPANTLASVLITSTITGGGTFVNNGTPVTNGQEITLADIAGGLLVYTAPGSVGTSSFTFQVRDNGSGTLPHINLDPSANTITFNVTVANIAPTSANNAITGLEDVNRVVAIGDFPFTDGSHTLSGVRITTLPTAGTLFLDANNDGVIDPGETVTLNQIISNLNLTNSRLKFRGALNANGTPYTTIGFTVIDNGGAPNDESTAHVLTVNLTAVNDAPSFTKGADQSIDEDSPAQTILNWATGISAGPADENGQVLSFTITNNTNTALFSAGPSVSANGTLTYTPALNAAGTATITLRINDNGGTDDGGVNQSATQSFTITLNAVNDAPVVTVPANNPVTEDTPRVLTGISFADVDAAGGTVVATFSVPASSGTLSATSGGGVVVAGSGTLSMTLTGTLANINTFMTGGVTYTPVANSELDVTLTVAMDDGGNTGSGGAKSDSKTMTLDLQPVNDAPVVTVPANNPVTEDTPRVLTGISFADVDAAGGTVVATFSVPASSGTLSATSGGGVVVAGSGTLSMTLTGTLANINTFMTGGVTYTPVANSETDVTLTVAMDDGGNTGSGGAKSDSKTMLLDLQPVNDAPVATVPSGIQVNLNTDEVLAGISFADVDAGANPVTVTFTVPTASGIFIGTSSGGVVVAGSNSRTLTLTGSIANINAFITGGLVTYRPQNGSTTNVVMTVDISDQGNTGSGGTKTDSKTLTFDFSPANTAPVVVLPTPAVIAVTEDVVTNISTVSFTDIDSGVGAIVATFSIPASSGSLTATSGGGVTVGGTATALTLTGPIASVNTFISGGNLKYTPILNSNTDVTLTININDQGNTGFGGPLSDQKTLTLDLIPVNDAPVLVGDTKTTLEDTAVSGAVTGTDVEGNTITFTLDPTPANQPQHGTVVVNTNGTFTYTPNLNYNGTDAFIVIGNDGNGGTGSATVNITVTPVNDAPSFVAGSNPSVVTTAGPQNIPGWATSLSKGPANESGQVLSFTVTNNNNTLFTTQPAIDASGNLTFTPAGTAGTATVTVVLKDNGGNANGGSDSSAPQTFTITVTTPSSTNNPPIIADIPKAGTKDVPVPFTTVDFTSKYTDETPLVKIRIVTIPTTGTLTLDGVPVTAGQEIPAADIPKLRFTPAPGTTGPISFQYNSSDGTDYAVTPRNVNITLNSVPVAVADNYSTSKGGTLTVALTNAGVLANDSDADGNLLTAIKVSDPAHGTLTLNANGTFVYVHDGGISTSDSFAYKVNDGTIDGNTVTVTISIASVNAPPVVAELPKVGTGFTPITFTPDDFRGKFSDPNGDPLVRIRILGLPPASSGVLKLNGVPVVPNQEIPVGDLGGLTFEPGINFSGTATFPWNGSDGVAYATNPANVAITIALSGDPTAKIGLAKQLVSVAPSLNGSYDVKFVFTAKNYGVNALENVSIRDNLALAFGGTTVTVKTVTAFGNLKANNSFNGLSSTDLLLTTSRLAAGEESRVELVVNVRLGQNGGTFLNSATAEGVSAVTGFRVTDVSTNGLKPDPLNANDVSPSESTPIQLDAMPVYVPQGFSPNGDGQNDKFIVQNSNGKNVSLEIYNRWGNRVYKSNDYRNDWGGEVTEGFFLGRDIPDGTYYYIIIIDKKDKFAGFITINR